MNTQFMYLLLFELLVALVVAVLLAHEIKIMKSDKKRRRLLKKTFYAVNQNPTGELL